MILRTTNVRLGRMIDVAAHLDDVELVEELTLDLTGGEKPRSKIEVVMCYSAGMKLHKLMVERCYTDKERMRRGLSSSEFGALQDLAKATNEEARHPALRGVGMAGHHARIFHAWSLGTGTWSPFPIQGAAFEILKPAWHVDEESPSMKFTLWQTMGYCPATRLDDEALHWRFV